jgi:4-hydroxyphenylpyruvate dioxygenase-like putative hemolysin
MRSEPNSSSRGVTGSGKIKQDALGAGDSERDHAGLYGPAPDVITANHQEVAAMALAVDALDHLVINVRDVEAAAAWYQRVLGMTREDFDPGPGKVRRTSMKFGRQKINLRPLSVSKEEWFTADHERAGSDDLCFLTSAPPQAVADHLRACGVAII